MKRYVFYLMIIGSLIMSEFGLNAQNQANFELGSGLNFNLNEGDYQFKFSGFIQPLITIEQTGSENPKYIFNEKRTYLNFSGNAVKEKISFFIQTDFSSSNPLLDAWIAYKPFSSLTITAGQKQSIANNREMLIMEDRLQFADRGLLSTGFCLTGREFGLFVTQNISVFSMNIVPQLAVTSGDGLNSFGADSRDVDLGGLKYSGRLDLYPFGFFSEGNNEQIADLINEKKLKMVLGVAASYNNGASNAVGEGHNDFQFYDENGDAKYPDYRKIYADMLIKFRGFSLLGEYVIATSTSLDGSYTDESATNPLVATQISEYLALGYAFNIQLGYVTKSGFALDARYEILQPEFEDNIQSVTGKVEGWTVGFSKYFKGNSLKIHTALSSMDYEVDNQLIGTLGVQVIF